MIQRPQTGFTLVEVLLATAIFALSIFYLSISFNNALEALYANSIHDESEKTAHWALSQIDFTLYTEDELADGDTLLAADESIIYWYADILPTRMIDLFQLEILLIIQSPENVEREFEFKKLLRNAEWYEEIESYEVELLEYKKEYFEELERVREQL